MATVKLTHEQRKTFITTWQTSESREEVAERLQANQSFPDTYTKVGPQSWDFNDVPLSVHWVEARARRLEDTYNVHLKWMERWAVDGAHLRRERENFESEATELQSLASALG